MTVNSNKLEFTSVDEDAKFESAFLTSNVCKEGDVMNYYFLFEYAVKDAHDSFRNLVVDIDQRRDVQQIRDCIKSKRITMSPTAPILPSNILSKLVP